MVGNDHAERSADIFLTSQPEVPVRPAGLLSLGSRSGFYEPYTIRSPHRIEIGDDVLVSARALLSVVEEFRGVSHASRLTIGNGCEIGRDLFVSCIGSIDIGAKVAISARVFIGDNDREYSNPETAVVDEVMGRARPVRIGDRSAIGAGAIILGGVTIGERAVVGAGSVVTRDVPDRCFVFGNPARIVRSWDADAGQWTAGPPRRS